MLSVEILRELNEKLRLCVEPCSGVKVGAGDFVYAMSGWHPKPHEKAAAFAETAAWALILFKTRQTEYIYRARSLLLHLLSFQEKSGLFPRYLHESGSRDCAVSTYRIYLVFIALMKWHQLALGADLLKELELAVNKIVQSQTFQEVLTHALEGGSLEDFVMPSWMARSILGAHVLETSIPETWSLAIERAQSSLGMHWLEKPRGLLPDEPCWLDVYRDLSLGRLTFDIELSHIWACLFHAEATLFSLENPQKNHSLFRSFPYASQRRARSESCFFSSYRESNLKFQFFADQVAVKGSSEVFTLEYVPSEIVITDENHPWIEIVANELDSWTFDGNIFSSVKMNRDKPLVLSFDKSDVKIEIFSNISGHWRQKPSLRNSGKKERVLYFVPRDLKEIAKIQMRWL